jgi:hypothetical protein
MDPEDTLMRCLEGWRVHFPLFVFLLWLFRAPCRELFVLGWSHLVDRKLGKEEGVGLGDILTFFCLRIEVDVGAV